MQKILSALSLSLCLIVSIISCGKEDSKVAVTSITISQTSLFLTEGETASLSASVSPADASNRNYSWSTSNPSVATVENGQIVAKTPGTAIITVRTEDGGKTANCQVTVKSKVILVTGVSLNKTSLELVEEDTATLVAIIAPEDATNKVVTWSASNSSVVTVNSGGVITALKEGSATVTATTEDGGKTASCQVTVAKKKGGSNDDLDIDDFIW